MTAYDLFIIRNENESHWLEKPLQIQLRATFLFRSDKLYINIRNMTSGLGLHIVVLTEVHLILTSIDWEFICGSACICIACPSDFRTNLDVLWKLKLGYKGLLMYLFIKFHFEYVRTYTNSVINKYYHHSTYTRTLVLQLL